MFKFFQKLYIKFKFKDMKNYNVKTKDYMFTIMADSYAVVEGKMVFKATGTIVKEINTSDVISVDMITENTQFNRSEKLNS